MPPRIRLRSLAQLAELQLKIHADSYTCSRCTRHIATAVATTPAPSDAQIQTSITSLTRYPPTNPPSHRNPAYRKSQLLRSYVSLLQTTPLIVFFQHNNLKASEWVAIRRELAFALRKVDTQLAAQGVASEDLLAQYIKLQVVKTNMLEPALRITEYFKPALPLEPLGGMASITSEKDDPSLTHALSRAAYHSSREHRNKHILTPLLTGSVAILALPRVSPQYLKAALSILSPQPGTLFAAPTRRANPTYHEPSVQDGIKKLLLLGARVDGSVMDMERTRWVGGITGGIDGLRAQLVGMLQGFGASVVQVLESGSRAVWWTMEGRRKMLEEEQAPKEEAKKEEESA
jgi:large subunit ribosomal protein L10